MRRLAVVAVVAILLAGLGGAGVFFLLGRKVIEGPLPDGPVRLVARPAPLNVRNPAQAAIGGFRYAGGIWITTPSSARLHGLSDLAIAADGLTLHSQGDESDWLDARLVLDAQGRLTGVTAGRLGHLHGPDGQPLRRKNDADAEGAAVLGDGTRLVSFERNDRIWRYPAAGGRPTEAPFPPVRLPYNQGLEAMTAFPAAGPDAYLAGAESGRLWLCRLSGACSELGPFARASGGYALTGIAVAPTSGQPLIAMLHRVWDPVNGSRARISLVRLAGPLDAQVTARPVASFEIAGDLTRDNFEGIAAVGRPSGDLRLYLICDDNFITQGTLLMAFDWTPPQAAEAAE